MWQTAKLGEICNTRRGTTITEKQAIKGDVPVIAGGVKPPYYHNRANREANCVTISGSGAGAGYVSIWNEPIFASDCTTVESKDETQLKRFIYYYLLSQQDYIYDNFRSGSAQPHVYAKDIATLDYPILSLAEQKSIVEKLDGAFAEIDNAIGLVEVKKTEIKKLKHSLLANKLGAKNDNWKSNYLTNLAKVSTGKRNANHAVDGGNYRFYTCASKHLFCNTKRFSGDCIILPGNGANVGDVYFYRGEFDAYQRTYVIQDITISPHYLMYHMLLNWKRVNENKQFGSATNFIKIGNFESYLVDYPSINEQRCIVDELDKGFAEIDRITEATEKQINQYQSLKSALLASELKGEAT